VKKIFSDFGSALMKTFVLLIEIEKHYEYTWGSACLGVLLSQYKVLGVALLNWEHRIIPYCLYI